MPRHCDSWILAALAVAPLACRAGAGATEPEVSPPTPVQVAQVESATLSESSEYVATLKSRHSVTLHPQIAGQVARILVKSGDGVKRGALLMQIDPSRQFHMVTSQKAVAVAKLAALNYAKEEQHRVATLFQGGAASQQELDQSKSALDSAQADFDALGAQVRESEVQLRYFSIAAPEDGVVGDIPVREGDYVDPSSRLTTVDENQQLEVYVSVPVERARELRQGMLIQLVESDGSALGDSYVTFISPQVDEDTQSVLVKSAVGNLRNVLRTSQFIRARVVWSRHEGPALPVSAVKRFNGQTFAFAVQDKAGKLSVQQLPVELGPLDGKVYPVIKGLSVGQRVVVSGLQKLHDGDSVAPLPAGASPG